MNERSSMVLRSVLAVVLTIGFYALALGICAALLGIDYFLLQGRFGFGGIKILFVTAVAIFSILAAVIPRPDRFIPPGPRLTEESQPKLFALIRDVAGRTDQAMPAEVYLVANLNAFVMERGGFLGMGRRRILGVGLPLLQTLHAEELRAVLGHEFGHFHGGDTAIGPWIYKTRAAIGRTLENLRQGLVRKPFEWYGHLFLRTTQAVSRRQELAADQLGAAIAGAAAMASGLKKVHVMGPLCESFLTEEILPAVRKGFRPALAEGFQAYLAAPNIVAAQPKILETVLTKISTDVYESHPCLRDRLLALGYPADHAPALLSGFLDGVSALTLLAHAEALEKDLYGLSFAVPVHNLNPLPWEEVGEKIHRPLLEEYLHPVAGKLAALKFRRFPEYIAQPEQTVPDLIRYAGTGGSSEQSGALMARLLTAHLLMTLCSRGWRLESRPGRELEAFPPRSAGRARGVAGGPPSGAAENAPEVEALISAGGDESDSGSTDNPVGYVATFTTLLAGVEREEWVRRCEGWGLD